MKSNALLLIFVGLFHLHLQAAIVVPASLKTTDIEKDGQIVATVIQIQGGIAPPLSEDLQSLFKTIPQNRRVILELDSSGGYSKEGYNIITLIQSERRQRKVDTLVSNGMKCGSMCIPIYVQGDSRMAGEVSTFMFHGTSTWYSNAVDLVETQKYLDVLFDRGVSQTFIAELKTKGVFTEPADFWMTGKQLLEGSSGVVSRNLPALIKHKPWTAPFDPNLRSR